MLVSSCQDSDADVERERYRELMDVIARFFFDLLVLGSVEDPDTGLSFGIPGGLEWAVYIEVSYIHLLLLLLLLLLYIIYITSKFRTLFTAV